MHPQLETERLILREMREEDAAGMLELNSDPEVVQYTGDGPFEDIDEALALIRGYDQYRKYQMGRLNMFLKTTGEYIGWCGLKYHAEDGLVDLGYRLHKRYWGKGYATEASIVCLNYGFNTLHLEKIIATAMVPNTASINVMKKLGMQFSHQQDCDDKPGVVYVITKDQWK
ncbi:GNAT family N-acetyltransferase [Mucilaginibacter sp. RS28]|uniref:GNAT family N-acetyltransferase n=1 Tax=Mucilaginibacter straminoryzae TaxID=2932774 RepID=A0A9X2BD34_9SPHI|nr:GNAT family N-acetyltransferase [Mucilaginibacter straminoryzae]MCJ8209868.1 GNAT family N-acetyltransferase [Mucilaginibacter straminoryzae]